ncbi:MAG TPA: hypothetical protein VFU15_03895 [Bacteroidia bacterium]|nr:hypothetical protein [Bacteroidia bacterium]
MKRIFYLIVIFLALAAGDAVAQTGGGSSKTDTTKSTASGAERVAALKVAFITKQLNLTPEEAEKFWPIYNEYQAKRDAIHKQEQENRDKIRTQADQLSPDELQKCADLEISLRQQDMALQVEMHEKLKAVLPPKKLAMLYVAEEDFKKELLRILTTDTATGSKGDKGQK